MKNKKYYGIGKDGMSQNKYSFNIFYGNKMICVAYYTRKFKFKPRFYFYSDLSEMQEIDWFSVKWFIGLIL